MKYLLGSVFLLALGLMLGFALGAGKPPAQRTAPAATQVREVEDSFEELRKADAELNRVYQRVRELYRDDPMFLPKLKEAQRAWIKFRDAEVEAMYPPYEGSYDLRGTRMGISQYEADLTNDRIKMLQQWLDGVEEGEVGNISINLREDLQRLTHNR
jgi:uncharacterized protein YecT (DUF1311 family)